MPPSDDDDTLVSDLHDLRAFAHVVDLRSFTAAAKLMGESKATLSRRIARLEEALSVSLLRRTPRTVEPTEEGIAYRAKVGEILELLGNANANVRRGSTPSGQLRVTVPSGFDSFLAPRLVRFAAEYPRVQLTVILTDRFLDLDAERIDVAIRATRKLADSSLVAQKLGDIRLIAVASPGYLKAHGSPKRPADLADHALVRLANQRPAPPFALVHKDSGERVEVRAARDIAINDIVFARELCVADGGISVLPDRVVRRQLDEGQLIHLLPAWTASGGGIYLLHRGGRFVPPKVRALREFLTHDLEKCRG